MLNINGCINLSLRKTDTLDTTIMKAMYTNALECVNLKTQLNTRDTKEIYLKNLHIKEIIYSLCPLYLYVSLTKYTLYPYVSIVLATLCPLCPLL